MWAESANLLERVRHQLAEEEVDHDAYNAALAKLMKGLKHDASVKSMRQEYKGTGSQKARRQLWTRFKNGAVLDIWLDKGSVKFGGVVARPSYPDPRVIKNLPKPEETYRRIKEILNKWLDGQDWSPEGQA